VANVRSANTWFVDTTSDSGTASTYVSGRCTLLGVIWYTAAAADTLKLFDKSAASAAAGSQKLQLRAATALNAQYINLSDSPITFPNGVWVTLTTGAYATLIFDGAQ
jgi:hypothetical protein